MQPQDVTIPQFPAILQEAFARCDWAQGMDLPTQILTAVQMQLSGVVQSIGDENNAKIVTAVENDPVAQADLEKDVNLDPTILQAKISTQDTQPVVTP